MRRSNYVPKVDAMYMADVTITKWSKCVRRYTTCKALGAVQGLIWQKVSLHLLYISLIYMYIYIFSFSQTVLFNKPPEGQVQGVH